MIKVHLWHIKSKIGLVLWYNAIANVYEILQQFLVERFLVNCSQTIESFETIYSLGIHYIGCSEQWMHQSS